LSVLADSVLNPFIVVLSQLVSQETERIIKS